MNPNVFFRSFKLRAHLKNTEDTSESNLHIKSFKTKNKYKWTLKTIYLTGNAFSDLVENDINKVKNGKNENIETQSSKRKARSYERTKKNKETSL